MEDDTAMESPQMEIARLRAALESRASAERNLSRRLTSNVRLLLKASQALSTQKFREESLLREINQLKREISAPGSGQFDAPPMRQFAEEAVRLASIQFDKLRLLGVDASAQEQLDRAQADNIYCTETYKLKEDITALKDQFEAAQAKLAAYEKENATLKSQVADLRAELQGKGSPTLPSST